MSDPIEQWKAQLMDASPQYQLAYLERLVENTLPEGLRERVEIEQRLPRARRLMEEDRPGAEAARIHALSEIYRLWQLGAHRPDAERGAKTLFSAHQGHEALYGTDEEKSRRWQQYRDAVAEQLRRKPYLSVTEARRRVADSYGVSLKTITKRTKGITKK